MIKHAVGLAFLLGAASLGLAGAQDVQACGGAPGFPVWVKDGVYQGTLGRQAIVLRVVRNPKEELSSAYFYQRKGVKIELTPFQRGNSLIWQESIWNTQAGSKVTTGCFELSQSGAGFKGTWTTPDNKNPLPVTLTPVNAAAVKLALPASPDLLNLQRTNPFAFLAVNHPWVKVGNAVREPFTGVNFPRLPNGRAAENAWLQDQQIGSVLDALECRSMVQNYDQDTYNVQARLTWQGSKLLSLREEVGTYCGGAHPESWVDVGIYDRASLKPVNVKSIWPKLSQARLKTLFMQTPEFEQDCREVIQDEYVKMIAGLSAKGLELVASGVPHAAAPCGGPLVVPFANLKAEANTNSAYYREIYR